MGSHFVASSKNDPVDSVLKLTGEGADYTFGITGRIEIAEVAYRTIRRGGNVVFIGQPVEESLASFPSYGLSQFDQNIIGSMVGLIRPYINYSKYLHLAEYGKINLKGLISRKMPLTEINRALKILEEGNVNRILLIPLYQAYLEAVSIPKH